MLLMGDQLRKPMVLMPIFIAVSANGGYVHLENVIYKGTMKSVNLARLEDADSFTMKIKIRRLKHV